MDGIVCRWLTDQSSDILLALLAVAQLHADQYVSGYDKKDGTHVNGYERSDADGDKSNNYSHDGNENPYTGKEGHKKD